MGGWGGGVRQTAAGGGRGEGTEGGTVAGRGGGGGISDGAVTRRT